MGTIKILYTIPNFTTAGSGRAMLNIIERLDRSRFSPSICVLEAGGKLFDLINAMGIPLFEADFVIPPKPYVSLLLRAKQAARVFVPYQFDLWHSFHYAGDYTEPIIARMAGAKGWIYTKKNMSWGDRSWLLRSFLAKRIIYQNTDMGRQFFSNLLFRHKSIQIPRGVNLSQFTTGASASGELHRKFNLPRDAVSLGCVAIIVPRKGHPTLIEAISKLPKVHIFLAGPHLVPDYFQALQDQIQKLNIADRVHFLGKVEDIPAFYVEMDLAVLPTRHEGCPVALLEGMACGKASISTDTPGPRDVIEDGVSGLLVPPDDPAALARAITRLIENPELRTSIEIAARQRIEQHFSIEREVAAHEALYAGIIRA